MNLKYFRILRGQPPSATQTSFEAEKRAFCHWLAMNGYNRNGKINNVQYYSPTLMCRLDVNTVINVVGCNEDEWNVCCSVCASSFIASPKRAATWRTSKLATRPVG